MTGNIDIRLKIDTQIEGEVEFQSASVLKEDDRKWLVGAFIKIKDGSNCWFKIEIEKGQEQEVRQPKLKKILDNFLHQTAYPLVCTVQTYDSF